MDVSSYATLTRQSGLKSEMQTIANNIANLSTTGFRREGVVFSEYVNVPEDGPSVSMATASGRQTWETQGGLTPTGSSLDFGIEGDGFFLIQTPEGNRLSRAGSFSMNAASQLVTPDGHPVLDAGGTPIVIQKKMNGSAKSLKP